MLKSYCVDVNTTAWPPVITWATLQIIPDRDVGLESGGIDGELNEELAAGALELLQVDPGG